MTKEIKTVLISVSDKTNIVDFATFLSSRGIKILSTGGTSKVLKDAGISVVDVSDHTGSPEIMNGRVKTLHPKIHGGLLGKRCDKKHLSAMKKYDIEPIDMVVINLYPFEETVAKDAVFEECIENIDIGGPSMIRSAAKNHKDVVVITNPAKYEEIKAEMEANNGIVSYEKRRMLALEAFSKTASYDSAISTWFCKQEGIIFPENLTISAKQKKILRYGENPHQKAALYINDSSISGVANAKQLQGKELSYNNISDTDAAFDLVSEFTATSTEIAQGITCAIIKHANPCGVAIGKDIIDAYRKALACDPVSAYGGILAFNTTFTGEMAIELGKLFAEVIIAPAFDNQAKEILARKKNLRVLETRRMPESDRIQTMSKSIAGGLLLQNRDNSTYNESALEVVTKRKPTTQEMKDLLFAFKVAKHVKSNAIVFAKDNATIGIGAGQMSRIDSSRIGAWKAKETATSTENASGSVFASDAFLPFADGLISAAEHGITAVIQPGGSIRDEEVIVAADERDIAMIFTGQRHFRH